LFAHWGRTAYRLPSATRCGVACRCILNLQLELYVHRACLLLGGSIHSDVRLVPVSMFIANNCAIVYNTTTICVAVIGSSLPVISPGSLETLLQALQGPFQQVHNQNGRAFGRWGEVGHEYDARRSRATQCCNRPACCILDCIMYGAGAVDCTTYFTVQACRRAQCGDQDRPSKSHSVRLANDTGTPAKSALPSSDSAIPKPRHADSPGSFPA
jgi:hypothetical protein